MGIEILVHFALGFVGKFAREIASALGAAITDARGWNEPERLPKRYEGINQVTTTGTVEVTATLELPVSELRRSIRRR